MARGRIGDLIFIGAGLLVTDHDESWEPTHGKIGATCIGFRLHRDLLRSILTTEVGRKERGSSGPFRPSKQSW